MEQLPEEVELWKEAVALEDEQGAKSLLYRAVKCAPHATELWLALAKLEKYDKAKDVLNQAIMAVPSDQAIWVNAAMLEEANERGDKAREMIKRAFKKLAKMGAQVSRETWLKEAVETESAGSLIVCRAIVKESLMMGMDEKFCECDDRIKGK